MRPREHYAQQLDSMHHELLGLGQLVAGAVAQAVAAFMRRHSAAAERVIAADAQIDQAQHALEEHILHIIALQQPVASDLRRLIGALEMASELERIGDYAKSIAKITIRDAHAPAVEPPAQILHIAQQALTMLGMAIAALDRRDLAIAQQIGVADDHVDTLRREAQAALIAHMQHNPAQAGPLSNLLFVVHTLERIADRTTNIAERVIFEVRGDVVELNP